MVDYCPLQDSSIPCPDAGMSFGRGDLLEVVDQTDGQWWQARKLPSATACAGLIPSASMLKRSHTHTHKHTQNDLQNSEDQHRKLIVLGSDLFCLQLSCYSYLSVCVCSKQREHWWCQPLQVHTCIRPCKNWYYMCIINVLSC